jgi:uncharacterized membrane protein YhaH (DUF805 family)
MSEAAPAPETRPFIVTLFTVTGRIGPGRYWLALACALAALVLMLVLLTAAMNPRGSGDPAFLILILLALFAWIILAAMTQRLRDAGKPPWLSIVFLAGVFASIFLSLVMMESAGPIFGVIGAVAIIVIVGHIDTIFKMRHHAE